MQRFEAFGRLDQRRRRFDPVLQQPAQLQRDRSLPLQLVMLRSRLGYWIAANKAARVVTLPLLVTRPPHLAIASLRLSSGEGCACIRQCTAQLASGWPVSGGLNVER
jgi:hypothetical protein